MSTQFTNRQWRLPNNENKDKQSNYSMDFDGSNNIECGNISALNGATQATWSCWYKKTASGSIYFIGTWGNGSSSERQFLPLTSTSAMYVYMGSSVGSNRLMFQNTSTFAINLDTWYHMAFVYNESESSNADKLKFYLNATPITNQTAGFALTSLNAVTSSFDIGAPWTPSLTGSLDEVAVFNRALTDGTGGTVNQIAALYGSSSTGIGNPMSLSPAPVAYYPLGDQDAFNGADYLVPNSSLKDYVFDFGGSSYIDLGDSNDFSFGNGTADSPFSVSFWAKLNSVSGTQPFLSKDTGSPNREWAISIFSDSSSGVRIFLKNQGGDSQQSIDSSTSLITGVWYHITTTYDGRGGSDAADGLNIYINGILDTPTNQSYGTYTAMSNTTSPVYIGKYSSNLIDGIMSNHQIFNTALPATGSNSVETLYNNGSPLTSMSGFTSLQGWWKLDASATYDGSNWTIEDSSSNSNDGTSSGMNQSALQQSDLSFKTSYSPYALDFDGTDDNINAGNDSSLVPSSLTISLWFKTSGSASAIPRLLNKSYGGSPYDSYFIRINNGVLNFKIGVSSASVQIAGTTNVVDGEWHNVIGTYDGSQLKLYLDGNSEATPVSETRAIVGNTSFNLTLGCELGAYGFSWPFTGSMSNVSIWNAGLTSAQVTEIYSEGIPQNLNNHSAYSNLVSWWQLGSNTSWVDPYWISLDEKGTNNGESQNVAAPNNMGENAIVDGVGSYANGLSSGMGGDEVIGDAPYSTANSLSVNMDVLDRTEDTPS